MAGMGEELEEELLEAVKEVPATESSMKNDADVGAELLCQIIVKEGMVKDMEKVVKLLDIKRMLKSRN